MTSATTPTKKPASSAPLTTSAQIEQDWEAVQKLALEVTSREGCLVTVTREQTNVDLGNPASASLGGQADADSPVPATTVWNFHLSGGYQSVMAARGAILREIPRDNRTVLKVARTDILEKPLAIVSPLKADVKRRLDSIAADSRAFISVVNLDTTGGVGGTVLATADGQAVHDPPKKTNGEEPTTSTATEDGSAPPSVDGAVPAEGLSESTRTETPDVLSTGNAGPNTSATVTFGLETERLCELVITGGLESVEIAKVRLLVMLDELVSAAVSTRITPKM